MLDQIIEFSCEGISTKTRVNISDRKLVGRGFFYVPTQNFAKIEIEVSLYDGKEDFQLIWKVDENIIPFNFLEGVVQGIKNWSSSRNIKGLKIVVVDGDWHYIDSRESSYMRATLLALDDAFKDVL
jgi:hypothetical protein